MTLVSRSRSVLCALFERQACWMIGPLAGELGCSVPSVRRVLADVGYYSSFTHNGKWYTLGSVAEFDRDGLWFSGGIGFSREGTLTGTLTRLAGSSPAGMTAGELGLKLRCRCHGVLVQLCRSGRLQRQKARRGHVYLSSDPDTAARQRKVLDQRALDSQSLPAEIAVLVLAEFIRNPRASSEDLARALASGRRVRVSPSQISRLFEQHGVKKTTPMPGHTPCGL